MRSAQHASRAAADDRGCLAAQDLQGCGLGRCFRGACMCCRLSAVKIQQRRTGVLVPDCDLAWSGMCIYLQYML